MSAEKKFPLLRIGAAVVTIGCFHVSWLTKPVSGQVGFQSQMWLQQQSTTMQLQNHGAERMMALQQRGFYSRMNVSRNPPHSPRYSYRGARSASQRTSVFGRLRGPLPFAGRRR